MKITPLSTALLAASAATSKNQVEAKLPLDQCVVPLTRGLLTGAISTNIKNIVSALHAATQENARIENADPNPVEGSQIGSRHSIQVKLGKAIRNFPLNFSSNALATVCVDKIFGVTKKATVKNLQQLALPVACMGITQEMLSDVKAPKPIKDVLSYGAFFAAGVAQGKAPVSTGLAIQGFVAGVSLAKFFGKPGETKAIESQKNASNKSLSIQGVSVTAASGFVSPESSKISDSTAAGSYDDYIRQRYRLKQGEKFWAGPDGSIFLPLSTS